MGFKTNKHYSHYRRNPRFSDRPIKGVCGVCGQSADKYHDMAKCQKAWIAKCDAEAAKAKGDPG